MRVGYFGRKTHESIQGLKVSLGAAWAGQAGLGWARWAGLGGCYAAGWRAGLGSV
jgi:hypothetical protein